MNPAQIALLRAELLADPLVLGYGPLRGAQNWGGLSALLCLATGPGAATLVTSMPRDQFMLAILPAILSIAGLAASLKDKWERLLSVIQSADSIDVVQIGPLLDMGVQDGLFSPAYRATIGVRACSRAETVCGIGTSPSYFDVRLAATGVP